MVEKNATPNSEIMKTLGQMTDSMNRLADEIHALRLELTPSLRKLPNPWQLLQSQGLKPI